MHRYLRHAGSLMGALVVFFPMVAVSGERAAADPSPTVAQTNDCLIQPAFGQLVGVAGLCTAAVEPSCTFNVSLCLNTPNSEAPQPCTPGEIEKIRVTARGRCHGVRDLHVSASGESAVCGTPVPITVTSRNRGKAAGRCVIRVLAKAKGGPARRDVKHLFLDCVPPGDACPCVPTIGKPCP